MSLTTNPSLDADDPFLYDSHQFDSLTQGYWLGEHRNYRLEQLLGQGGMGQAWLATQIEGGEEIQKVVCKVLPDTIRGDEAQMAEVKRIFNLTRTLNHQNICPLLGIFLDPKFGWFLVMAYADAGSLADWFQSQPNCQNGLPLPEVLKYLAPIADALDRAHALGVVHRDVKPQNIVFRKNRNELEPWLIDFGIASKIHSSNTLTTGHSTAKSGTPRYMAPEQFLSTQQTAATDQYAFATIVYEFLSGRPPFDSENIVTLGMLKCKEPVPKISQVSASVNAVLKKALSVKQEDRFPSCRAFIEALNSNTAFSSRPQTTFQKFTTLPLPHKCVSGIVILVILIIVALSVSSQNSNTETVSTDVQSRTMTDEPAPATDQPDSATKTPDSVTVPTDVPTLAEAYAKIPEDGTIILKRGVHKVPETITITKSVKIIGDVNHPEYVVLQGDEESVFHLKSGFAEIAGVTIQNEGKEVKEGTYSASNDAVQFSAPLGALHDCVFTSTHGRGFIVYTKDSSPDVKNCTARNCGLQGFFIASGASGTFRNCTASGNEGPGMEVRDAQSNPTVEACQFTDGKSVGIGISDGASGTFRNCTASGNAYAGMQVQDAQSNPTVEDCKFTDGKAGGIVVNAGASGTFRNCTASGNAYPGMEVRDAQSNPTAEDCQFTDGKDCGILVWKGASGTFENCTASENAFSGMEVRDEQSNPTVKYCTFKRSRRSGVWVYAGASGTFRNCTASENTNAGMVVSGAESNPTVEKCQFTDGKSVGIGISDGASGTFTNCTASGNEGPGMEVRDAQSNPTVETCKFTDGKSVGIGISDGASGTFRNCTVSGNTAAGMGVKDAQSNPTVEDCTFEKNQGSGVYVYNGASGTFRRSKLSGNSNGSWNVSGAASDLVREGNTPNK